jgi:lysozyme
MVNAPTNAAAGPGPQAKPNRTLAAVIGSAAAAALLMVSVPKEESSGRRYLQAYADVVGVWTYCDGITRKPDGSPVRRGDKATPAQCDSMLEQELIRHAAPVIECAPQLKGRANQVVAVVDLAFNIGPAGVCRGAVGERIRAGDWIGAEAAIGRYNRATFGEPRPGRDCVKKRGPGWACVVAGLDARRKREQALFAKDRPAQGVRYGIGN